MSKDLVLVKKAAFGNTECEFYEKGKEIFMTRQQIGEALGYADPTDAIAKIHTRNKARLNKFSRRGQIVHPSGRQETTLYSARGVYEICRFSQQEKANDFYDFVYDILEGLRIGELKIIQASPEHKKKIDAYCANAEARLLREKRVGLDFVMKTFGNVLSKESLQTLAAASAEMITGMPLLPKPTIDKSYTATEIANELGTTANRIGRLAEEHKLKTDENGHWVLDKSRYSNKQVKSFIYNESGRLRLKELFKQSGLSQQKLFAA